MRRAIFRWVGTVATLLLVGVMVPSQVQAGTTLGGTELVSKTTAGDQATIHTYNPAISGDGRYVVFETTANLHPSDSGTLYKIYRRDRNTNTTERVSVDNNNALPNNSCQQPSVSGNGQFVAFASPATDLLPAGSGDTANWDVYVRNMNLIPPAAGAITRVSVRNGTTIGGNSTSDEPAISCTGRYVAFISNSNDLISGDTNGFQDVFVYDTCLGAGGCTPSTKLVSLDVNGAQFNYHSYAPEISCDGRFVTWYTYMYLSTNTYQVWVRDLVLDQTSLVSVSQAGEQSNNHNTNPSISADGRFVAFESTATDLISWPAGYPGSGYSHVYVRDTCFGAAGCTPSTAQASINSAGYPTVGHSYDPSISGDGRYIAYYSTSSDLVLGDFNARNDAFVHDRLREETYRVSTSSTGVQGNDHSCQNNGPKISQDGRYVAFESQAFNLVTENNPGTNQQDIFVKQPRYTRRALYDYDGDGKMDIMVYRRSNGVWYMLKSTNGFDQTLYDSYLWGTDSTDMPVCADYDGDGKMDMAVWRGTTAVWYILLSSTGYDPNKYLAFKWGASTDQPIPGDFDGDGKTDIAVYRPSTNVWYILRSSDMFDQSKYQAYLWGGAGDEPIPNLVK